MTSKQIPGSLRSEAARLTAELGYKVTIDKVRWWKSKDYPLHDTEALKHKLKGQERMQPKPQAENENETLASLLITDKVIAKAEGDFTAAEVLTFIRDLWSCQEDVLPEMLAGKTEDEIRLTIRRSVGFTWMLLDRLIPIHNLPEAPDWLRDAIFPPK